MNLTRAILFSIAGLALFLGGLFVGRGGEKPSANSSSSLSSGSPNSANFTQGLKSGSAEETRQRSQGKGTKAGRASSELIATLEDFPPSAARDAYLRVMLRDWAQSDPEGALAYARTVSSEETDFIAAAYQGWAEGDPKGAWASALTAGTPVIDAVLEAVVESSPENLEPFLGELDVTLDLDDPEPLGPVLVKGVRAMVGEGLTEEAIRVSSLVLEDEFRRDAFQTIALGLLEDEMSEEEVTQILLSFPEEEDRAAAAAAVSRMMLEDTPDGATHWAATLPEGSSSRKDALHQSVTEWFERDFYSAMDWLNENANDPDLDEVVAFAAVNERMVYNTPEISMEWVESIHNQEARLEGIVQVAGMWALDEPEKALQYIADSEVLSPEEKESARLQLEEQMEAP